MENNNTRRPAHVGRTILIAVLAVVILVLLLSSLYVVQPNEYGVVRQFGAVVDVKSEPGLYFKIPFVQEMSTLPNTVLLYDLPENYNELFKSMMGHDLGFLAIGILAPLAEEMVFRGAILRTLLSAFGKQRRWLAIGITALLFAVIHGNLAQGFGAFFLGLLIGWMYYRTGSIVPGVVFHWVNNSIAVILYRIAPQFADMTLTEYFQHDTLRIGLCMLFSLMIFGASLYQLRIRLN